MGRHSKASKFGKLAAVVGAAALLPVTAGAASAQPPDSVAQCESGGDIRAENPVSSASGKWQIIDGTWAAYGGLEYAPRASGATEAQQDRVAANILAGQGIGAWDASSSCHGSPSGGSTSSPDPAPDPAPEPAPEPAPARESSTPARDSGRAADGTGTYTCTEDKLYFAACDPGNLGETVQYPLYDGHGSSQRATSGSSYTVQTGDTLSALAVQHGTTVSALAELNGIGNVDLIHAGAQLQLR